VRRETICFVHAADWRRGAGQSVSEGTYIARVVKTPADDCFELSTFAHLPVNNNAKRKEQCKLRKSGRIDAKVDNGLFLLSVSTSQTRFDLESSLCLASEVFEVTLNLPITLHTITFNHISLLHL
jgi:hypothetical protein